MTEPLLVTIFLFCLLGVIITAFAKLWPRRLRLVSVPGIKEFITVVSVLVLYIAIPGVIIVFALTHLGLYTFLMAYVGLLATTYLSCQIFTKTWPQTLFITFVQFSPFFVIPGVALFQIYLYYFGT